MNVGACMKTHVYSIPSGATIVEAAETFVRHHIGSLPVVDEGGKPIGVLRLMDILSLELPDFVNLLEDVNFVHDFGAVETTRPSPQLLKRPVTDLMRPATFAEEDCGLLRAYALMLQNDLQDLPVTNSRGQLVGIVSRTDVGTAVLSFWKKIEGEA
jgi:CBS domain-containing protein